jgi:hypothetical protein
MSGALVRALGVGRPVLVTAGTPAADEFPDGVVVPVSPGPWEEDELAATLDRLLGDAALRESIGTLARDHVRAHHDLDTVTAGLAAFLAEVHGKKAALEEAVAADTTGAGGLEEFLLEEVRAGARDLGLLAAPLGLADALLGLAGERR